MKRLFDFAVAMLFLIILFIPIISIALAVKISSHGPILHWSRRIGLNNKIFLMPKFRTMLCGAPIIATHLFPDPEQWLTPIGSFLRRTSLDELPQLWSILRGDMSIVGPRPALFNQSDLIALRTKYQIDRLVPGLTGWAQVNGRDDLPLKQKVELDKEYLKKRSFIFDLKIIYMTFINVITRKNVSH